MYSTCTFCYASLGQNDIVESFPVARRVAFDPRKGCLWAVCPSCARWNLAPLEERWEAVEECERRFRATSLRYTVGEIGLAWLGDTLELVRVGPALKPEVAAWRYGRMLTRRRPLVHRAMGEVAAVTMRAMRMVARSSHRRDPRAALAELVLHLHGDRVVDVVGAEDGDDGMDHRPVAVVRFRHLLQASLARPESGRPWGLQVPHDHGVLHIQGDNGVRAAARMLAIINGTERARGGGFSHELIESAVRKVEESARSDGYFNRVLAIALRCDWGRTDRVAPADEPGQMVERLEHADTDVQRMAFRLTGRTFWGHGGIGSEPRTVLLDVPLVDRLALEMAAHEEAERRALEGELESLADAWREADEIAAIADALLRD
ncbi:MAG: hypothetical protein U0132_00825 [Gemmatimonadaceae bacterium]